MESFLPSYFLRFFERRQAPSRAPGNRFRGPSSSFLKIKRIEAYKRKEFLASIALAFSSYGIQPLVTFSIHQFLAIKSPSTQVLKSLQSYYSNMLLSFSRSYQIHIQVLQYIPRQVCWNETWSFQYKTTFTENVNEKRQPKKLHHNSKF